MVKIEIKNFGTNSDERLDEFFSLDKENLIKKMNLWNFGAILRYEIHYDYARANRANIIIDSDNDDLVEQKLRKFYETEKVNWGFPKCTINFSRR